MSRKLMLSSIAIAATATLLGVGTFAKFSDQEGIALTHSVKAGVMDLELNTAEGNVGDYATFDVTGAKPGDHGYKLIHFVNTGDVEGKLFVKVVVDSNNENGIVEPEVNVDTSGAATQADPHGIGEGELADAMVMSIDGIGLFNEKDASGKLIGTLASYSALSFPTADAPGALWTRDGGLNLTHDTGGYLAIQWWIPADTVGNEIMSDSVTFHLELNLLQA